MKIRETDNRRGEIETDLRAKLDANFQPVATCDLRLSLWTLSERVNSNNCSRHGALRLSRRSSIGTGELSDDLSFSSRDNGPRKKHSTSSREVVEFAILAVRTDSRYPDYLVIEAERKEFSEGESVAE